MKTNKAYTVPRIASKSGLFLLIVLLGEAKVSKELGINLENHIVKSIPTPFSNEHVDVEVSWYHSYGSWYSDYERYDAFASPF